MIEAHCRELKMPSVRRDYPKLMRHATHDGWSYEEFLLQLLEGKVLSRRDSAVAPLMRQARFPDVKTFEQLDWQALQGVERPQLAQLATCEYLERAEDVVIAGPIGTGTPITSAPGTRRGDTSRAAWFGLPARRVGRRATEEPRARCPAGAPPLNGMGGFNSWPGALAPDTGGPESGILGAMADPTGRRESARRTLQHAMDGNLEAREEAVGLAQLRDSRFDRAHARVPAPRPLLREGGRDGGLPRPAQAPALLLDSRVPGRGVGAEGWT